METVKQSTFLLTLAGIFIISAFTSKAPEKKDLLGFWNLSAYNYDTVFYKKADSFEDYNSGIFLSNSHIIRRRYCGGWCPLPPIHCNYNGTCKIENDVLELRYQTYSHRYKEKWQILGINDSQLIVLKPKVKRRRRGFRKSKTEKGM